MRSWLLPLAALLLLAGLGWALHLGLGEDPSATPIDAGIAHDPGDTVPGPGAMEVKPPDRIGPFVPGETLPGTGRSPGEWGQDPLVFPEGTRQITGEDLMRAVSKTLFVRAAPEALAALKSTVLLPQVPPHLTMGDIFPMLHQGGFEVQVRDSALIVWRADGKKPQ